MAAENQNQERDSLVGKTLGQYQIMGVLGKGGMATVYRAYQPSLERYIALKVLFPHFAQPEFVARFKREALAAGRLSHPSVVHIYDAGEAAGYYYIAMEYIEGGTLKDRLDERGHAPLDSQTISQVVQGIGSALEYAHRQGIIHRDIKPANIMFTKDNRVVLADLGLAKFFEAADLTQMTALIGTPFYMSPEQARSQAVDARSDIYSFGVVIYEMLTGRVPFEAETPWMAIHQHIYEMPPPIRQLNPVVSEALAQVVHKALAKDPKERYQHVEDLAQAFAAAQKNATGIVPPAQTKAKPNTLAITEEKPKTAPALYWAGGGLSLLILAALVLIWNPGGLLRSSGGDPIATPTATVAFSANTPMPSIIPAPSVTAAEKTPSVTPTATISASPSATLTTTLTAQAGTQSLTPSPSLALTRLSTPSPTATRSGDLATPTSTIAGVPPATFIVQTPTDTPQLTNTLPPPTNTTAPTHTQAPPPTNTTAPPTNTTAPPTNTTAPPTNTTAPTPTNTPRR
jgi:serine/threonine-protein kinase